MKISIPFTKYYLEPVLEFDKWSWGMVRGVGISVNFLLCDSKLDRYWRQARLLSRIKEKAQ